MSDHLEFYKKHRPKTFKQMVGNNASRSLVFNWVKKKKVPHTCLFTGPSGCGKTTLARILKDKLNCGDMDFTEINAAANRGIDMVRDIANVMNMSPMMGEARVWLIDEAHKLTNEAQNAFLKMLEDTPRHCYFFLATTDPKKLIPTVRNRCSEVVVHLLKPKEMEEVIQRVADKEDIEIEEDLMEALVEQARGSSRRALVLLDRVATVIPEKRLDLIHDADTEAVAFDLCRKLMFQKPTWKAVTKIINDIEELEPEGFRRMIINYATKVMLGGDAKKSARAFVILDQFQTPYYDTGTAKANLIYDCYAVSKA